MTERELTPEQAMELKRVWWLFPLLGVLSLAAGIIIVAQPSHSLATLAVVAGIFLLLDGITELINALGAGVENRGLAAIVGILGIVVGIVLIRHPFHGVSAVAILFGIWLVAVGAIRLMRELVVRVHPLLGVLIAFATLLFGIAIIANPSIGYTTLALLGGIWLIINGIGRVALGFSLRTASAGEGRPSVA